jgi:hypothetical protein
MASRPAVVAPRRLRALCLDTSPLHVAALALYASNGYCEIARGQQAGFPMIFRENTLSPILVWATSLEHDSFGNPGPVDLKAIASRRGRPGTRGPVNTS